MTDTAQRSETARRLRRISLRQLVYLSELERHRNFGRAAEALALSQPTLSQQIAQLERTLGVPLVDRASRHFRLTPDGEFFLARCRKAMGALTEAVDALSGAQRTKPLRIGIPSYMSYPVVADHLRRFGARNPGTFPHLVEMPAEAMSRYLNEGELDAGFLSLPAPATLDKEMAREIVWEAPYELCLPKRHPLAQKSVLLPQDVAALDIILIPRDHHPVHFDFQIAALRALGIEPRIVETDVNNTQSQMGLTSAGVGACVVSRDTSPLPADLVLRPTEPELGKHVLALVWSPNNRHPLLGHFRRSATPA